jgi:hypothetical protein
MKNSSPPIYLAKLRRTAGEPLAEEFTELTKAIQWVTGDALKSIGGKAERADIYLNRALVWTKLEPMTAERAQAEKKEALRLLTLLGAKRGQDTSKPT